MNGILEVSSGAETPGLSTDEFAALMAPLGPWAGDRRLAVAVSGGADSLCLAWLASRWGRPLALVVDHGLRPESADEASLAATRLARFGVSARILRLRHLSPGPGLAARARQARYAALQQAASAEGLSDLLVGHHARDQAETLLIREESGSGPAGLAGMAHIVETPDLRLVRPLLDVAPERLRITLRASGIAWSEDPSNADTSVTRVRIRHGLAGVPAPPAPARHALRRAALEARQASCLAGRATLFPEGFALLTAGPIEPGGLAALIRALSGADYAPRSHALARLSRDPPRGTLGGVQFRPAGRLGAGTLAVREEAALAPPVAASPGAVWDRRWRLSASGALPEHARLGAVGNDAPSLRRHTGLPACVVRALPALRAPGFCPAVPHLGVLEGWTNAGVGLTLQPANPVAGAAFGLGDAQWAPDHHVLNGSPSARLPL